MKFTLRAFFLFSLTLFILISCSKKMEVKPIEPPKEAGEVTIKADQLLIDARGLSRSYAIIRTVHGNLSIKFYPKKAPNTVTRIIQLARKGFYDGLEFHRVKPNFVVQTGDPTNTGDGGSGLKLQAEFNSIQHIKGTIGLARNPIDVDSGDSQFYIALDTLPHLDGKYTVFARAYEGLDILEKIKKGDKIISFSYVHVE